MYVMGEIEFVKVGDLVVGSRGVNVVIKVLSVGDERVVVSRRDGSTHRVAEALVGDETGTVLMTLWDEDIDLIREREGSTIVVRGGYVGAFGNSMRLNIGRYGRVEDSEREIEEVNEENNLSEKRISEPGGLRRRPYGVNRRKIGRRGKRRR